MTKCGRNEGNRKSTAYNQTGQSYYEQLSAYNSMCTHLRRLLLAKGVVDSGTKNSTTKMTQWGKRSNSKPRFARVDLSDSTIDRLALGSYHRPLQLLRRNTEYDAKRDPSPWKYCIECYNNYSSRYPELKAFAEYAGLGESHSRATGQTHSRATSSSSAKRPSTRPSGQTRISRTSSTVRTKQRNPLLEINIRTGGTKFIDGKGLSKGGYTFFHRGFEDDSFPSESSLDIVTHPETRLSLLSTLTKKHEAECELNKRDDKIIRSKAGCAKDEREMYAKFVFDITRDIMENGLYTDAQLHKVFTKHIKQNKAKLNMRKMLAEIYQLKVSLNMFDDSELDDEVEGFLHDTKKLTNPSDIRDSDPVEKHVSYRTFPEPRIRSASGGKSVVLVDANPELLVTERDVLLSLMEADIEPKVAEKICKSLYCKSRSVSAVGSDQLDPESVAEQAEELQSLASQNLSEGSVTSPYEIETKSEIRSKENKDTQINWRI